MKNKDSPFQIGAEVKIIKEGLQSYGLIGTVVDDSKKLSKLYQNTF